MRRLLRLIVLLYPPRWRRRYGHELDALLEDVPPGWHTFFDVAIGVMIMQTRTLATIPVLSGIAGTIVALVIATSSPVLYASSATLSLASLDATGGDVALVRDVRASIEATLGDSIDRRRATSVELLRGSGQGAMLRVTYMDRDAATARDVAQQLASAVTTRSGGPQRSAQIIEAAALPTAPADRGFAAAAASGGLLGLAAGGAVALLLGWQRRSPAAS